MDCERITRQIPLTELTGADELFTRLCGISPEAGTARYGTCIEDARKYVKDTCIVSMVYRRVGITEKTPDHISLATGQRIVGTTPAMVLEKADELFAFVVTLSGFTSSGSDDMMMQYFIDTWGTSYIECGQIRLANMISEELEDEGMIRSHMWCPGQHGIELSNQRPLFDLLHPEDIGCTLTDRMMMIPVKSGSGIMGILPQDTTYLPRPCDYCRFRNTCPSTQGCSVI